MFKYKEKNKGFSLIGVMVTLFIVAVGLTSIIALTSSALNSSNASKMRLIASSLAQESIEIVRDIRRSNIEWDDWYSTISDGDYRVQYNNTSLLAFVDTPLMINANNYYQYDTGNNSAFSRKVTFTKLSANELKLSVEIKWKLKSQWSYLTVENRLWNWK